MPARLACPYHTPILEAQHVLSSTSNLLPMTRFTECAWSDIPFGLLYGIVVGASTSGGCNCVQLPQQASDPLSLELDAIVRANEDAAGVDAN
jgi:hypothetical protein